MRCQVEIRVKGKLDPRWSEWLDGLAVTHGRQDDTILTGSVCDQSALYGLMSKLRDLGIQLSGVKVSDETAGNHTGLSSKHGSGTDSVPVRGVRRGKQRRQ